MMAKRSLEHISYSGIPVKLQKCDGEDIKLQCFLEWCGNKNLDINSKVRVGREGSCAQYGMVAVEDIQAGQCLFEIPRNLLLSPQTSKIAHILCEESGVLASESGWVPLLLALMHEYTCSESLWRPYLQLVPDFSQLDLPLFWTQEEREAELRGTGVIESVARDEAAVTREFTHIVLPFIHRHPHHFTDECRELSFYKRMVAFVMAYSFTEPSPLNQSDSEDESHDAAHDSHSPPMMVPMADILNHIADNNAHLNFGQKSLTMVATKDIKKGSEVFNTYGELSNAELLHMYGFAQAHPLNTHDVVELSMDRFPVYFNEGNLVENFEEKWAALTEKGVVAEGGAYVLGAEGVLTEDEMTETLKVLCMTPEQLLDYRADAWMEAEEISLTTDAIPNISQRWRSLLAQ